MESVLKKKKKGCGRYLLHAPKPAAADVVIDGAVHGRDRQTTHGRTPYPYIDPPPHTSPFLRRQHDE